MGELVKEPVDHPVIRPSINAVARTYDLAVENPDLASAWSSLSNRRVNRFLHITESAEDVVSQNRMQRRLGQLTGTCFQRCVGMDALNSLYSVTFEMDRRDRITNASVASSFTCRSTNCVIGGAMTDPKGDRSKGPADQADPDTVRPHRGAASGRHRPARRQDAPDWLHQLPLDRLYADHAAAPRRS